MRSFVIPVLALCLGCGAGTSADDVQVLQPERAVVDARALIEERRQDPEKYPEELWPDVVPESLRLKGLRYALVHEDHVDLVLARNPDWNVGARIWASDARRKHVDQPTKYAQIFFFDYTNDAAESADNIR